MSRYIIPCIMVLYIFTAGMEAVHSRPTTSSATIIETKREARQSKPDASDSSIIPLRTKKQHEEILKGEKRFELFGNDRQGNRNKAIRIKQRLPQKEFNKLLKSKSLARKMSHLYSQLFRCIQLKELNVPESYRYRYEEQLLHYISFIPSEEFEQGLDALEKVWIEEHDYLPVLDQLMEDAFVHKTALRDSWEKIKKLKDIYAPWSKKIKETRNSS